MARALCVIAFLCSWSTLVAADEPTAPTPAPAPAVQPTTLAGRVTDVGGKAIAGARVHVLPRGGARVSTETDKDGRYAVELGAAGAYSVVIAVGQVNTYRQVLVTEHATTTLDVLVEVDLGGGEVIKIIDERLPPPAIPAQPVGGESRKSLPYSKQAMERDAWARAWLLLDIDETGRVTRLKMLKRPGFDLDQIAIDEAFKLKFEPALDAEGRPMRTYLLWDMEWPSAGWLRQNLGTMAGRPVSHDDLYARRRTTSTLGNKDATRQALEQKLPGDSDSTGKSNRRGGGSTFGKTATDLRIAPGQGALPTSSTVPLDRVPCAEQDPLDLDKSNRAMRDCSRPDLTNIDQVPWITRDNAQTALAELAATHAQVLPRKRGSRTPELIAGGVAVVSAVALGVSFYKYNSYNSDIRSSDDPEPVKERMAGLTRWNRAMFVSAASLAVSTITTAVLLGRHKTRDSFTVQPTRGGGAVSWGRSF
jgi:hypothetical protein